MANYSFICPYPLITPKPTDEVIIWAIQQGNCAVRCPNITFTRNEWHVNEITSFVIFICSLVGSVIILVHQSITTKFKAEYIPRIMFIFGFCVISLIMVIFFAANGVGSDLHDKLTCLEEYAFIEDDPVCIFQASGLIFLIN